jgi:hypothetical protein
MSEPRARYNPAQLEVGLNAAVGSLLTVYARSDRCRDALRQIRAIAAEEATARMAAPLGRIVALCDAALGREER